MKRRIFIGIIVLMVALVTLSQCVWAPPIYWGEAIHARVVDADSGQPVADAVVVADWKLYGGGVGHGGHHRSLFAQEAVTGMQGEFTIAAWGPTRRPMFAILDTAPWLGIFKTGYDHRFLWNEHASNAFVRRSDWNNRTIQLKRTRRTNEARIETLRIVLSSCAFQPLMLTEILKERTLYYGLAP